MKIGIEVRVTTPISLGVFSAVHTSIDVCVFTGQNMEKLSLNLYIKNLTNRHCLSTVVCM